MSERGCSNCWFAGMLLAQEHRPDGPLKRTCMVLGKRRKGGCPGWEEDRADYGCPKPADIAVARAVVAHQDRIDA